MDQEKETKRQAERCRALAQRIVRELTPASIQVLGGSGALAEALEKAGAQLLPENAEQGTAALLVVEDPEWVDLPALQCAQVLLVCTDASAMADCAKQLAAQGLYRDFEWKNRGKAQQTALFCRSAAVQDAQQLLAGYEMTLDDLRERMQQAERTGEEQTAQLERLRSDLSLSRSHEQDLEKTLNNVTSSTFWKMSWPLRYFCQQGPSAGTHLPAVRLSGPAASGGHFRRACAGKAKKEYAKLFPGRTMRADRFASAELLVRQAADQPAAPRISIVVPLYNTPQQFLVELLDSVQNQTYQNLGAVPCGCRTGRDGGPDRSSPCCGRPPHPLPEAWKRTRALRATPIRALRWQRASSSPCWTTMISCTPVLCGTWHRPLPNRAQTLCIRMK